MKYGEKCNKCESDYLWKASVELLDNNLVILLEGNCNNCTHMVMGYKLVDMQSPDYLAHIHDVKHCNKPYNECWHVRYEYRGEPWDNKIDDMLLTENNWKERLIEHAKKWIENREARICRIYHA